MKDKKVVLRPLEEGDTANIVRWRNEDEVRRNLFSQALLTEEQHLRYFRSVVQCGRCKQYVIVLNDEPPTDIGTVFLKNIDLGQKQAEFGIFIGERSCRGRNLSLPATDAILEIAFEELGLDRVYLSVIGDNISAIKTYRRVGFREYGRDANAFRRESGSVDVIHMDLTKAQWEREKNG